LTYPSGEEEEWQAEVAVEVAAVVHSVREQIDHLPYHTNA
jgi:hypothetical protein